MKAIGRAFAILALLVASEALFVSGAEAETVTLSCRADDAPSALKIHTLRINYSTGLVEELRDDGTPKEGAATASISPNAIVWSSDFPYSIKSADGVTHQGNGHWEGRIDRLSGAGQLDGWDVSCRTAAQKF